ncbi:Hypothetical protein UVM_LOCUS460 [uncultured virus]|nr:Hypothetical protein UVM_LOCUS460 [uncultured virus]
MVERMLEQWNAARIAKKDRKRSTRKRVRESLSRIISSPTLIDSLCSSYSQWGSFSTLVKLSASDYDDCPDMSEFIVDEAVCWHGGDRTTWWAEPKHKAGYTVGFWPHRCESTNAATKE